jgi:hypothetical protein
MLRTLSLICLLPVLLAVTPASALTKAQKAETCKFGADDQKLTGAKRKVFLAKCMSNRDDKRGPAAKPTAKPAAAAPPAAEEKPEEK